MNNKTIIKFWYNELNFPKKYDREFYSALENSDIRGDISIENYDLKETDGKKNLLYYLYFCEELKKRYESKGISKKILLDTLSDIVRWTNVWSELKGELYLGEISWLSDHMKMKLFRLGRLQYCFSRAKFDVLSRQIKKNDNIIDVHIPAGKPLKREDCTASFKKANVFFKKYFPEFGYNYYMTHSWLLDENLKEILKPESNILNFQNMFEVVKRVRSDDVLRFVFKNNTTRENIAAAVCASAFEEHIKKKAQSGGDFYANYGVINKNDFN